MIVIAKETENKLLQTVRTRLKQRPLVTCFSVALSRIETDKEQVFSHVIRLFQKIENNFHAQLFFVWR